MLLVRFIWKILWKPFSWFISIDYNDSLWYFWRLIFSLVRYVKHIVPICLCRKAFYGIILLWICGFVILSSNISPDPGSLSEEIIIIISGKGSGNCLRFLWNICNVWVPNYTDTIYILTTTNHTQMALLDIKHLIVLPSIPYIRQNIPY